jgi:hypothetical protein
MAKPIDIDEDIAYRTAFPFQSVETPCRMGEKLEAPEALRRGELEVRAYARWSSRK